MDKKKIPCEGTDLDKIKEQVVGSPKLKRDVLKGVIKEGRFTIGDLEIHFGSHAVNTKVMVGKADISKYVTGIGIRLDVDDNPRVTINMVKFE